MFGRLVSSVPPVVPVAGLACRERYVLCVTLQPRTLERMLQSPYPHYYDKTEVDNVSDLLASFYAAKRMDPLLPVDSKARFSLVLCELLGRFDEVKGQMMCGSVAAGLESRGVLCQSLFQGYWQCFWPGSCGGNMYAYFCGVCGNYSLRHRVMSNRKSKMFCLCHKKCKK